jgi:hypothetical protein
VYLLLQTLVEQHGKPASSLYAVFVSNSNQAVRCAARGVRVVCRWPAHARDHLLRSPNCEHAACVGGRAGGHTQVPFWCQRASSTPDGVVVWDYHVSGVLLQQHACVAWRCMHAAVCMAGTAAS